MTPSIADFLIASTLAALAGLGGAAVVFSEFDDAPGGILIGILLIAGAMVLGWKALQRRRGNPIEGLGTPGPRAEG